jgi:hypothetical protein
MTCADNIGAHENLVFRAGFAGLLASARAFAHRVSPDDG